MYVWISYKLFMKKSTIEYFDVIFTKSALFFYLKLQLVRPGWPDTDTNTHSNIKIEQSHIRQNLCCCCCNLSTRTKDKCFIIISTYIWPPDTVV